jgi:RNA polymerase sigma-70 factor (ECF subfamily)
MTAFPLPHSALDRLIADLRGLMPESQAAGKRTSGSGIFRRTPRRPAEAVAISGSIAGSEATETVTDPTMPGRTDEQLLVAYRNGDPAAFTALVERYRHDLIGFLQRFLGSRAAADDAFQDAFLQVHLSAESFDASRRFKPWLYTIAANKARDLHRRRRRRSAVSLSTPIGSDDGRETSLVDLLAGDDDAVDMPLLDAERQRLVKEVVDGLPPHYREILLLSYFQRLSYNQIADSLQIPLGTVKSRLHAAVAHFADSWRAASGRERRRHDLD